MENEKRPNVDRLLNIDEQEIIDVVARSHGKEWAEAHWELILDQAREIGDLPPREDWHGLMVTEEERDILICVSNSEGIKETIERATFILNQARAIGDL